MVGRDRADDFCPGDRARAALFNAAANGFQHHLAGMQHRALVAVIEGQRTKGPLHHHLAEAHGAGLQRNISDTVNRHARRHLKPEAGITWDWQKALGDGAHVGRQLRLQGINKDVGAQLNRAHITALTGNPMPFAVGGHRDAAGAIGLGVNPRAGDGHRGSTFALGQAQVPGGSIGS